MFRITIKVAKRLAALFAICTVFASQSLAQGSWVTETPVPTPRPADPAIVIGGKIYVTTTTDTMGAAPVVSSLVVYDPATDTWDDTKTADPLHRGGHGAAAIDGKLYVVGGCLGNGNTGPNCGSTTSALSVYDPAMDTWTSLAPMPTARSGSAVAALGGKLYVAGGNTQCDSFCPQNDILEIYDPASNTWISSTTLPAQAAPMPETRESMKPAVIGGKLYVVGGVERIHPFAGGSFPIGELWVYDPATNAWDTSKASMPTARTGHAAGAIGGQMYAVGGVFYTLAMQIGVNLDTLERYDPATDTWATLTPMPTERLFHGAAVVGDQLYVMGGGNSSGLSDALEVFTPDVCVAPAANIINWWPLDEIAPGNVAVDLVGGADGAVTGNVNAVPAKVNNGYEFPGGPQASNSSSVDVTGGGGLNRVDMAELTIEAWIDPDGSTLLSDEREIVRKNYTLPGGGSGALLLSFQKGFCSGFASTPCLSFAFPTSSGFQQLKVAVAGTANDGGSYDFAVGLHHVAATYDGSNQRIYFDGRELASRAISGPIILSNGGEPTTIGAASTGTTGRREVFDGIIDEVSLYDRALSQIEIQAIVNAGTAGKCTVINAPPTAEAGANQSIHVGVSVNLDGSGSSDDGTASEDLLYAWSFDNVPAGSVAAFVDAAAIMPTFTPDLPGDYVISLAVTDEGGLSSTPDTLTVSSLNVPPTADAGMAVGGIVGFLVMLDGSDSIDADLDPLTFTWALTDQPVGSTASLSGASTDSPEFIPDLAGSYTAQLIVNDGFADSTPDDVIVSVVTAEAFAEVNAAEAINAVASLPSVSITTKGNQKALGQHLSQVIAALQSGDNAKARFKLIQAIERTDGCAVRSAPDTGNGPGPKPKKDYITDCASQAAVYPLLTDALAALAP